jgi:hypothetical protein
MVCSIEQWIYISGEIFLNDHDCSGDIPPKSYTISKGTCSDINCSVHTYTKRGVNLYNITLF